MTISSILRMLVLDGSGEAPGCLCFMRRRPTACFPSRLGMLVYNEFTSRVHKMVHSFKVGSVRSI